MMNKSGFSLIELLTVMVVIVIMAAVAIPLTLSWMPNMRFRSATRNVFHDMQMAKIEAIKRNERVVLLFNTVACVPPTVPAPGGGYLVFVDDGSGAGGIAGNEVQDGSEPTLKNVTMPRNVALCNKAFFGGADTGFTPTGIPLRNGRVTLNSDQGRSSGVVISTAGNISIQ